MNEHVAPKPGANHIGNAGEHYVMACLLARGHHAGLADRGNPFFDVIVRTAAGNFRTLRVKSCRGDAFQWTAKAQWDPLPGFDKARPDPADITALVAFCDQPPGPATEAYVVPTARLVTDLNAVYEHYHAHPNRDGSARKWTAQRVLRLGGEPRADNTAYAFRDRWADCRDAWQLLE